VVGSSRPFAGLTRPMPFDTMSPYCHAVRQLTVQLPRSFAAAPMIAVHPPGEQVGVRSGGDVSHAVGDALV